MRIDRLDLTAFGPFTGVSLDLSAGAEGLHVVYGPNEAGKSSALRAVRQLFCGIPHQSSDDFRHDYKKMAVGAVLRGRDGEAVEVVRRKGTRNTLLAADGTPVAGGDDRLTRLLGGMAPTDFTRRYVIDHAELVAGGKEVLAGQGDLGRLLFAAGGGSQLTRVGGVQKELEAGATTLFLPRGSKPTINTDLARLEELRKEIARTSLPSAEWVEHDRALREARAREAELTRALAEADRERNRLKRVRDAVAPAGRRREILAELADLGDVPRLSDDFLYRYHDATSLLPSSEQAEAEARRRVADLTAQLAGLDVPEALLDQAEAIEGLHRRLGGLIQAATDRRNRESELARLETEARAAACDLGRDVGLWLDDGGGGDGPLAGLRLTAAARARVLELADDRAGRLRARDDARQAVEATSARRAAAAARLEALGPERTPAALRKTLKAAQKAGDLDGLLRQAREVLRRDEARAPLALAALGRWPGPFEAAETLVVPAPEVVDAFDKELTDLEREAAELEREASELERAARDAEARLDELRLQGEVPTEEALADARGRRDELWRRIRSARACDDASASAFEGASRHADDLADRLRREADRVANHARFRAEVARNRAARDERADRRAQSGMRHAGVVARWSALWEAAGVSDPGPPVEMRGWLRRLAELAALARAVREQRGAVGRLESQIAEHREAVLAALAAAGEAAADAGASDDEPLAELVEKAADAVDRVTAVGLDRKRQRQEVESLDAGLPGLGQAAAAAAADWDAWLAAWGEAVRPLGLDPDATPKAATAAVARTVELFDRLDRARTLRREIEATAREAERFEADVKGLALRVAPDLAPVGGHGVAAPNRVGARFDAEAVAAELHERLKRARAARLEHDHLISLRAEKEQAADAAREEVARHRETLAALRREARCDRDEAIPEVARRDKRRRELEAERDRLDAELRKLAAGVPLAAFVAEVGRVDPDAVASDLARLDEAVESRHDERTALLQQIGAETTHLERMKGGADAAELKQAEEDLRARVREEAEQYARLRLAAAVLRAGVERYRQRAQSPVLARAGETFARLSLGSFASLRVDYDDRDEPVLLGVRPGGESVGVAGMSLGTADQLFLSLRLATLEAAPGRDEPLPLIVDDVLVQFDDARAAATLEVLAGFSRNAQVLLLTHHEHLVRLAERRLGPEVVFTHRLPAREAVA